MLVRIVGVVRGDIGDGIGATPQSQTTIPPPAEG